MTKLHPADALATIQRIRRKAEAIVTDAKLANRPNLKMHGEEIRALANILVKHMEGEDA